MYSFQDLQLLQMQIGVDVQISSYCFFLGDSMVSWKSKKQKKFARSSSEAEYRSLAATTCELQWLYYLMEDLKVECVKQPVLYCDNQSALYIASNPLFHERTKHLIDCHVVQEKCNEGLMRLLPISSSDQTADLLTKALHPGPFQKLLSKLRMVNIYKSST